MRPQRINRLAGITNAETYLEIGVCHGETFFEVGIPRKIGVDPNFRFDFASRASATTEFHPTTSDDYFLQYIGRPFDIIYLDGLHTFDQVARDFFNSFRTAHDRTIWLIDDTVPNDVFSAMPSQEKCYSLRRKTGNDDWSWMGDVYKLVFLIARIAPTLHFATFKGHGQTVVWKSGPRAVPMDAPDAASIGTLTYEGFIEHLSVMNLQSDETIYDEIVRALR